MMGLGNLNNCVVYKGMEVVTSIVDYIREPVVSFSC